MENKLTDNEIIKALDKCASIGESCEGCPFYDYTDCESRLKEEFHNFIKRKDAEIERLEKANESFSDMGKLYSEIKSEAIKEFAESFLTEVIKKCQKRYCLLDHNKYTEGYTVDDILSTIDIVKEMMK